MTQAMHMMITALDQQDCDGATGYVVGGDVVGEERSEGGFECIINENDQIFV